MTSTKAAKLLRQWLTEFIANAARGAKALKASHGNLPAANAARRRDGAHPYTDAEADAWRARAAELIAEFPTESAHGIAWRLLDDTTHKHDRDRKGWHETLRRVAVRPLMPPKNKD